MYESRTQKRNYDWKCQFENHQYLDDIKANKLNEII